MKNTKLTLTIELSMAELQKLLLPNGGKIIEAQFAKPKKKTPVKSPRKTTPSTTPKKTTGKN
jgi:hypothetical protein